MGACARMRKGWRHRGLLLFKSLCEGEHFTLAWTTGRGTQDFYQTVSSLNKVSNCLYFIEMFWINKSVSCG